MNKLKWWFRIVGAFYLLLTSMNVYFLFFGGIQMLADTPVCPRRVVSRLRSAGSGSRAYRASSVDSGRAARAIIEQCSNSGLV